MIEHEGAGLAGAGAVALHHVVDFEQGLELVLQHDGILGVIVIPGAAGEPGTGVLIVRRIGRSQTF